MTKLQRRKAIRRRFRFIILLLAVFFIAFFLSSGTSSFLSKLAHKANNIMTKPLSATAEIQLADDKDNMTVTDKINRLMFIKRAVSSRLANANYVPLQDVPDFLKQAVIAVEDNKFYTHHGFDLGGIARASLVNLQYGQIEEGASTITQQLVKNLFLSNEQSLGRKTEEILLALDMEANYSKDEILELYLNSIYYGSSFYGIGDASKGYFGKDVKDLTLPEAAMLAGLPNAPSLYSPYVDFMMAKKRQFIVIDAMVRAGYIDENTAKSAKIAPIYLAN